MVSLPLDQWEWSGHLMNANFVKKVSWRLEHLLGGQTGYGHCYGAQNNPAGYMHRVLDKYFLVTGLEVSAVDSVTLVD
jgi:hypothetical protein